MLNVTIRLRSREDMWRVNDERAHERKRSRCSKRIVMGT